MCGRYTLRTPPAKMLEQFQLDLVTLPLFVTQEVAPTQNVAVVRANRDGHRELLAMHWGLVPPWAVPKPVAAPTPVDLDHNLIDDVEDDELPLFSGQPVKAKPKAKPAAKGKAADKPKRSASSRPQFNARCETAAEKPMFRQALRQRRCLIPADGFYEWQPIGGRKQKMHIAVAGHSPIAFAGLWEQAQTDSGPLVSCTILTTAAHEKLTAIHDRMPVIVAEEDYAAWLDPTTADVSKLPPILDGHIAPYLHARGLDGLVFEPA